MLTAANQFLIYQSEDGTTRIDVKLEAETLWLNQKQLTELFGKAKGTISEHIKHIFAEGELAEIQLFGYSEQLLQMASNMMWRTTTLIWFWPWALGCAALWGCVSGSGLTTN